MDRLWIRCRFACMFCEVMEEEMIGPSFGGELQRGWLGSSASARAATRLDVLTAARTDACVLLTGRTREARDLAYLIHKISGWGDGAFRVVDCTRPEPEVSRQLFATITGESSHAIAGEPPHARPLQDGSVLIQEVGRLSLPLQRRLADLLVELRAEGTARRVRRRIMACSAHPLLARVLDGSFDDGLFYRLNIIHLTVGRR